MKAPTSFAARTTAPRTIPSQVRYHPRVLSRALAWWRAEDHNTGSDRLNDMSGRGHHMEFGSTSGADTNDPKLLTLNTRGEQYLYVPGGSSNVVTTPDAAPLDITGDIEIRARIAADDWTSGAAQYIVAKWVTTGDQRSYRLNVAAAGNMALAWSEDGAVELSESIAWSAAVADGQAVWVRVTLDVDDGAGDILVTWYRSFDDTNDPDEVTWTQIGTDTKGSTSSIFAGTGDVGIGARASGSNFFAGKIYRVQVLDGIGGTVELDVDFTTQPTEPFATFIEGSANAATMTIERNTTGKKATIVDRTMLLLGTDDYLEDVLGDDGELDMALTDPISLVAGFRKYADITPVANEVLIGKRETTGATRDGYNIFVRTAGTLRLALSDGTNHSFDTTGIVTAGQAQCAGGVRSIVDDDVEAFLDGAGTGSPVTDISTGGLGNAVPARLGANGDASPANFLDGELYNGAIFREALSDSEMLQLVKELQVA